MKIIFALTAALLALPAAASAQSGSVQLEIAAARPEGRLAVAVYGDADSFRHNRNPVRTLMLDRSGAVTRTTLQGLAPGRYVIAVFQDLDGNGTLSTGAFGIPKEPFGFSNNARVRFGPPSFDAAAITVRPGGGTERITLGSIIR
jgi:uncharacterized protein (DUF2141 family)